MGLVLLAFYFCRISANFVLLDLLLWHILKIGVFAARCMPVLQFAIGSFLLPGYENRRIHFNKQIRNFRKAKLQIT